MTAMMRDYPHLPVLSLPKCVQVFKALKVPPTALVSLSGFSRMQVYRWLNGRYTKPHPNTLQLVSLLAYRLLRAAKHNAVPKADKTAQIKLWRLAVNDDNYPDQLKDMSPTDLLPKAWVESFNLPSSDQDAPETVL